MRFPHDPLPYVILGCAAILLAVALAFAPGPGEDEDDEGEDEPARFEILPARFESAVGEAVRFGLELRDECGGDYEVEILAGAPPAGIRVEDDPPRLVGAAETAGDFEFILRVRDLGCDPPEASEARFEWTVTKPR